MSASEETFLEARIEALTNELEKKNNLIKSVNMHLKNIRFGDFEDAERKLHACITLTND